MCIDMWKQVLFFEKSYCYIDRVHTADSAN